MEVGPEWSLETIRNAIGKGTHSSNLSPRSIAFCKKEILERIQWGFSIILLVTEAITLFCMDLRISRLALVYQVNRKPRFKCNSSNKLDAAIPSVNASMYKVTYPK